VHTAGKQNQLKKGGLDLMEGGNNNNIQINAAAEDILKDAHIKEPTYYIFVELPFRFCTDLIDAPMTGLSSAEVLNRVCAKYGFDPFQHALEPMEECLLPGRKCALVRTPVYMSNRAIKDMMYCHGCK
jgi:hypothetical protein